MSADDLAVELHLPISLVTEQVGHLADTGLLGFMAKPEGISLTKPPELISIKEILDATHKGRAADATVPLGTEDSVRQVLRRRDAAIEQALSGQTLRSLIDTPVSHFSINIPPPMCRVCSGSKEPMHFESGWP